MKYMILTIAVFLSAPAEPVTVLPEDASECHLSLFVSDSYQSNAYESQMLSWFDTNKTLKAVKQKCHYHVYQASDPTRKAQFPGGNTPSVMLQDADGKIIYKQTRPKNGDEIASAILVAFDKRPWLRARPWLRPKPSPCPTPAPSPTPSPSPSPTPVVEDIPDTVDEPTFPWGICMLILLISAAAASYIQFSKRVR